ncbi:MAG: c-type cytochrome [Bacteroidales bacterium]
MLRKNFISKISLVILFVSAFALRSSAQQGWDVPEAQKNKNSNIVFNASTATEGQAVYSKNCASCHGEPTKNNSMKSMVPVPPDLSGAKTNVLTDGELSYILATGRGLMPSFKNILSESDRWKVIGYLRSFHKGYTQVVSKTDPNKSKLVKINTTFDKATNSVVVEVKATEKSGVVALKDAEITVFAKRYFGKLQIDKAAKADASGKATFKFDTKLPGDKEGNVTFNVKVSDEVYGEVESESKMQLGVPTDKPSLTKDRAMWNVMKKAPWWILITYFGCLSVVIGFFVYVLKSLKKINELGAQK